MFLACFLVERRLLMMDSTSSTENWPSPSCSRANLSVRYQGQRAGDLEKIQRRVGDEISEDRGEEYSGEEPGVEGERRSREETGSWRIEEKSGEVQLYG
jgi:hypothetical protein